MKFLIVEDEPLIAQRLKRMIGNSLDHFSCDFYLAHRLKEAQFLISKQSFDLCFLDLNLHGMDGFRLLSDTSHSFKTIITSAYHGKALEAFEYQVLDFVPKPYKEKRVKKALELFLRQRNKTTLLVQCKDHQKVIDTSDILFIKGAKNYCQINTADGRQYLCNKSIGIVSEELKPDFLRIHKSYLVPKSGITALKNLGAGNYRLMISSGLELPVGRSIYRELVSVLDA